MGTNGHENRGFYRSMVGLESTTARFGALTSRNKSIQKDRCDFRRESLIYEDLMRYRKNRSKTNSCEKIREYRDRTCRRFHRILCGAYVVQRMEDALG